MVQDKGLVADIEDKGAWECGEGTEAEEVAEPSKTSALTQSRSAGAGGKGEMLEEVACCENVLGVAIW